MREDDILDAQIILSSIFIITVLISIFITYNEKTNQKFVDKKTQSNILILNRIVVLIIFIIFLYFNYINKYLKQTKKTTYLYNLDIVVSYLTIIAAIITLYVSYQRSTYIENPLE